MVGDKINLLAEWLHRPSVPGSKLRRLGSRFKCLEQNLLAEEIMMRRNYWIIAVTIPLLIVAGDVVYWRIAVERLRTGYRSWISNSRRPGLGDLFGSGVDRRLALGGDGRHPRVHTAARRFCAPRKSSSRSRGRHAVDIYVQAGEPSDFDVRSSSSSRR